jgi:hypothetical protein
MKMFKALVLMLAVVSGTAFAAPPNPPANLPFEYNYDWLAGWKRHAERQPPNTGIIDFHLEMIAGAIPKAPTPLARQCLINAQIHFLEKKQAYMDGYNY